jgi:hypothetical protein
VFQGKETPRAGQDKDYFAHLLNRVAFASAQRRLPGMRRFGSREGNGPGLAPAALLFAAVADAGSLAAAAKALHVTVFYVADGRIDEDDLLRHLGGCLGPMVGPGPANYGSSPAEPSYPGMLIEVEGIAMHHPNGQRLPRVSAWLPDCPRVPSPFSQAPGCQELIFTSCVSARDSQGKIADPNDCRAELRHATSAE